MKGTMNGIPQQFFEPGCLFQEEQRIIPTRTFQAILNWLTWIMIAFPFIVFIIFRLSHAGLMFTIGWCIIPAVGLSLRYTILKAQLTTKVYSDRLTFEYWPFYTWPRWLLFGIPRPELKMKEIADFKALKYKAWVTGWGIHYGPYGGWVFNTSGNMGVAIVTDKGKKILIGSQKPEELFGALQRAKSKVLITSA